MNLNVELPHPFLHSVLSKSKVTKQTPNIFIYVIFQIDL